VPGISMMVAANFTGFNGLISGAPAGVPGYGKGQEIQRLTKLTRTTSGGSGP